MITKPRKVVALDFESYYDNNYGLKKLSTTEYIRHHKFKVQCVGIRKLWCDKEATWWSGQDIGPALEDAFNQGEPVGLMAHHTQFDGLIIEHWYPEIQKPAFYYDTLSMARPILGNRVRAGLDVVAKFYQVGSKLEDILGLTKGIRDLDPELMEKLGVYCANDVDIMVRVFQYLVRHFDGIREKELDLIHLTTSAYCRPVLEVDRTLAKKCLVEERVRRDEVLRRVDSSVFEYMDACGLHLKLKGNKRLGKGLRSRTTFPELLRGLGVEPPTKISTTTNKPTYAFAKDDLEFQELREHLDPEVRNLVEAKLIMSSTIAETRPARLLCHSDTGPLPIYLKYWGAHTGRWSGGDKMNPQNFPRSGDLRRCIRAARGYKLIVCDSAQIEARVNAWWSDEASVIEAFKDPARDPYVEMAAEIYGIVLVGPSAGNPAVSKAQRFVGKVIILGAGYQMGWRKLAFTLRAGKMGPPMPISDRDAQEAIMAYRQRCSRIAGNWSRMEDMLAVMAGLAPPIEYKGCTFKRNKVILPNGMALLYPDMRAEEGQYGRLVFQYNAHGYWRTIYGGMLTENVIQALARIVVSDQALLIAERYPVISLLVHDEVVPVVREEEADKALAFVEKCMRVKPSWALDLPVDCEGAISDFYIKP